MTRPIRCLTLVVGLALGLVGLTDTAQALTLRWFGHAFFLITSSEGVRVAMDAFGEIGYPIPEVAVDVVTVSHEHGDHNAANRIAGSPTVLRGLKAGGTGWNSISYGLKDIRITALPAYRPECPLIARSGHSALWPQARGTTSQLAVV